MIKGGIRREREEKEGENESLKLNIGESHGERINKEEEEGKRKEKAGADQRGRVIWELGIFSFLCVCPWKLFSLFFNFRNSSLSPVKKKSSLMFNFKFSFENIISWNSQVLHFKK